MLHVVTSEIMSTRILGPGEQKRVLSDPKPPSTKILSADERLGRVRDSLWLIAHLVVTRQRRSGRFQFIVYDRHGGTVTRCSSLEALEKWTVDAESRAQRKRAAA